VIHSINEEVTDDPKGVYLPFQEHRRLMGFCIAQHTFKVFPKKIGPPTMSKNQNQNLIKKLMPWTYLDWKSPSDQIWIFDGRDDSPLSHRFWVLHRIETTRESTAIGKPTDPWRMDTRYLHQKRGSRRVGRSASAISSLVTFRGAQNG
jgi:hypothetical protein